MSSEPVSPHKIERIEQSERAFEEAWRLAMNHRYSLKKCTQVHYQLRSPKGWLLNIYPGNQRLYHARDAAIKPPILWKVLEPMKTWTVFDIVQKCVEEEQK